MNYLWNQNFFLFCFIYFLFFWFCNLNTLFLQLTEKSYELSLKGSPYWMAPEVIYLLYYLWSFRWVMSNAVPLFFYCNLFIEAHESFHKERVQSWHCHGHWYMELRVHYHWNADRKTSLERIWRGEHLIMHVNSL